MLKKFNTYPNAYYNYLKNRKAGYYREKELIKSSISDIYHSHGGVDGYRTIHAYLVRQGYDISRLTVHKYMNIELRLYSISRKRKDNYEHGTAHKVFENKFVVVDITYPNHAAYYEAGYAQALGKEVIVC